MKKIKDVKSVLFDMDGVLVDSFDAWFSAFKDTLQKFGRLDLKKESFKEKYWGHEVTKNMKKLGIGEDGVIYCRNKYEEYIPRIKIYPDTKRVLRSIDKKMGVVTSTSRERAEKVLDYFDMREFFDIVMTPDQVKEPKPAPDSVIKACEELEVDPGETVFIGDSKSDIKAGREAGCITIGKNLEGDIEISELNELLEILD